MLSRCTHRATQQARGHEGVKESGEGQDEGEDGDEQHRPRRPDEPPSKPQAEPEGPTDVEVEPGGDIIVELNGSAAHKDADAAADGGAEEAHPDMQDEAERLTTRRNASIKVARWCASAHI